MSTRRNTHEELLAAADVIDRFIQGQAGPWEWDDFTSVRHRDHVVEALRREVATVCNDFPALHSDSWCSEAGIQRLREIAARVRDEARR